MSAAPAPAPATATPTPLAGALLAAVAAMPISAADRQAAAWFSLDAIACVLGAQREDNAHAVLAWARSEAVTPARRAFVYGALSNILEMDAMHRASSTHPGTVVVPAALALTLALAVSRQVSGEDFLAAVLKGFEVSARIGEAAGASHARLYQATSTCCPFGAALSAALLLGLDPHAQLQALGNAGTRSGGLWQFVQDGSLTKQWHAGRAAEDGVCAAQLAGHGLSGPARILEGEKGFFSVMCPDANADANAALVAGQRDTWSLPDVSYKPWPSPRHTHPAIDAALRLSGRGSAAITSVTVQTYPVALQLCNMLNPETEHAARFSIAYCVAAALQDGQVDAASFLAPARERHRELTRHVRVSASDRFAAAFPAAWGAEVSVVRSDGSTATAHVDHAKGDPLAPMSDAERYAKALDLLGRGGVVQARDLADQVLAMASGKTFPAAAFSAALRLAPNIAPNGSAG